MGIGAVLFLLGVLLYRLLIHKIHSFNRNLKTRKEQRQKFAAAFERLVTDMDTYSRDTGPKNNVFCLRIIRRFQADLLSAKPYIKKSVHDVALSTVLKVKKDCEKKKIDVPFLQNQYEIAMKRKHPTVEPEKKS